uniref:Beta-glucosidase-related glycosidase n=1 Tax=uncultured bacterium scaffold00090 TaxID=1132476 RepID=I7ARH8_9BACT|nr:beta-glucosidase-related glycosidase [uncultured bacterium scaffold00090]
MQPFEREHIEIVRKVAPECTLLLKKDDTLPLSAPCRVALYGSGARKTIKGGTGSGDVNVRHFVTVEEGLEKAGFEITSKNWLESYDELLISKRAAFVEQVKQEAKELGINPVIYGMGKAMPEPEYELSLDADGELAVYVLARISGEGADRSVKAGDIGLSDTEIRDILALNSKFERFVLVLNIGGMVNLEPVKSVKNILLLGQLGTPTGDVLADLLLGKSYPSGKLAMTWAPIGEYPSTEGFGDMDDTPYTEGIYVGYRYFDTVRQQPDYPFGFGLSYTAFEIAVKDTDVDEEKVTITAEIKNTGDSAGKEVVQAYYSAPAGKLNKPYQELAAFAKTKELRPGESETVTLCFHTADMASYDTDTASYILEAGTYVIRIGNSSRDTFPCCKVLLEETAVVRKVKNICPGCDLKEFVPAAVPDRDTDVSAVPAYRISRKNLRQETVVYDRDAEEIFGGACTWEEIKRGEKTLDEFVGSLNEKQLSYLSIGLFEDNAGLGSIVGASAQSVAGAAGETTRRLEDLGVPALVMADGPAGLRLCTKYKVVDGKIKGMNESLAGFMEFMDQEQLRQMAAMAPKPDEAELKAPMNYVYCTAIPVGTALAQSFSREVCRKCGDMVGDEMEKFGVHLWLAPAINIQRSPLCGRNFEYYSEDPLVSGLLAAAVTEGVQAHKGCGVTVKHFALNNQETNRMVSNSIVSERAIREIYLKGFEICVKKSQPHAFMSSYNLVNGEHACNSKDIQTCVLRNEWGYQGVVMTDWYAASTMMTDASQRKNKHPAGSPAGCIHAGNDLIMPGMQADLEDIMDALSNGNHVYPITKAELQITAKRVLATVLKLA